MNRARLVFLLVAFAAALVLAFLVRNLATPKAPTAVASAPEPPKKPMTQVLVAKRNLPIGTRLTQDDLTWQPWPLEALNKAFITDGMAPKSDDTPKTIRDAIEATTAKAAKATQDLISPTSSVMAMVGAIVAAEQVRLLRANGIDQFHFYTLNRPDLTYAIAHILGVRPKAG